MCTYHFKKHKTDNIVRVKIVHLSKLSLVVTARANSWTEEPEALEKAVGKSQNVTMCYLFIAAFSWLISRINDLKQVLANFQAEIEEDRSLEMWGLIASANCFIAHTL